MNINTNTERSTEHSGRGALSDASCKLRDSV